MQEILSILIPTYNRKESLFKNIKMLEDIIIKLGYKDKVKIIISDNCSSDGTYKLLELFVNSSNINLNVFKQEKNYGAEKNMTFLLDKTNTKYAMLLGDDDYISIDYLKKVINYLENEKEITCIQTNSYQIDNNFNKVYRTRLKESRDKIFDSTEINMSLMFNASQLSGLVFLAKGTLESYHNLGGNNLYPQVYFAAYNMKRGKTVLITDSPVQVTITNSKDWSYHEDGLITDILQNVKMVSMDEKDRFKLEKYCITHGMGRYMPYVFKPTAFFKKIYRSENCTNRIAYYIALKMLVNSPYYFSKKAIKKLMLQVMKGLKK